MNWLFIEVISRFLHSFLVLNIAKLYNMRNFTRVVYFFITKF